MKIPRRSPILINVKFKEKYQSLDINKLSSILKKNIRQNKKDLVLNILIFQMLL